MIREMQAARTDLLLGHPFFGSQSLRLRLKEDPTCGTAWTDGTTLGFNPEWVERLTPAHRKTLVAHETMHCAFGHIWRRGDRDPRRWNEAADYAINSLLVESGFDLPPGGLIDPQYKGLSAEAIYGMRPAPPPDQKPGNDPGGCGEVRDAPPDAPEEGSAPAWEVATLQAVMQSKLRGELPAGLERLVTQIKKPACHNLLAALSEFVERAAHDDYSWQKPNRRYLASGLYLPSLTSETLPPLAAAVDTSRSINEELLANFAGALQTVLDTAQPEHLTVYVCDERVHSEHVYLPGDEIPTGRDAYRGGGGTNFVPVFERIEAQGETPCCCIYLTDLEGRFPDVEPPFPTLWVVVDPHGARAVAPFGETLWLDG